MSLDCSEAHAYVDVHSQAKVPSSYQTSPSSSSDSPNTDLKEEVRTQQVQSAIILQSNGAALPRHNQGNDVVMLQPVITSLLTPTEQSRLSYSTPTSTGPPELQVLLASYMVLEFHVLAVNS